MEDDDLIERILDIFDKKLHAGRPGLDVDLLGTGVLDSLSLLDLLAEVEAGLAVAIDLSSLDLSDLESVKTIAALVERNR